MASNNNRVARRNSGHNNNYHFSRHRNHGARTPSKQNAGVENDGDQNEAALTDKTINKNSPGLTNKAYIRPDSIIINGIKLPRFKNVDVFAKQKALPLVIVERTEDEVAHPDSFIIKTNWGVLTGVNSSGSFTSKSENANFYGTFPVDLFFGVFATSNFNDKWALNLQITGLNPRTIITKYTDANITAIDSNKAIKSTSSRKLHSIDVPLNLVYKVNSKLSFMAGPVISIPITQVNTNTTVQPSAIKSDAAYYVNLSFLLREIQYSTDINFSFSAGVKYQFNRFILGATWVQSLSGYEVVSGFDGYKSYNSAFQLTLGYRLNNHNWK